MASAAALMLAAAGCGGGAGPTSVVVATEFDEGAGPWEAGFADFAEVHEPLPREAGMAGLPSSVSERGRGFRLSGQNRSDDLFMFITRPVTVDEGVMAGVAYEVRMRVRFASDAPSGCAGIGGAPGESVYVKAGAADVQPQAVLEGGRYRMNVDKGNQATGGRAAVVIGDVANGIPCEEALEQDRPPFRIVERSGTLPEPVNPTDDATLWLLVGTDSGFEGTTTVYFVEVAAELIPRV